ncbi:MAG: sensor histidine kinase [Alkalispirochaeta sp.]
MHLLLKTDAQLNLIAGSGVLHGVMFEHVTRAGHHHLLDLFSEHAGCSVRSVIHEAVIAGRDGVTCDVCHLAVDSAHHPCTATVSLFYTPAGDFVGAAVLLEERDPPESEIDRLYRHLQHQEALMHELRHRVKNDMNFVHSMLSLQARTAEHAHVRSSLLQAADRVLAVNHVYSRLHGNHDSDTVDGGRLVDELIDGLRGTSIPDAVRVVCRCDHFTLAPRAAVSLGLIINELITNAVKYAIPENRGVSLQVSVTNHEHNTVRIVVRDPGPGFPEHICRGEGYGYGLTIIQALIEQEDGTLKVWNDGGGVAEVQMMSTRDPSGPRADGSART